MHFRVAVRLALAPVALGIGQSALSTHTQTKACRSPGFEFVSATGHATVPRRIATGMRGVTGELNYEEECICGCYRGDRGLSGCSGEEEKGASSAGCVGKQQRE